MEEEVATLFSVESSLIQKIYALETIGDSQEPGAIKVLCQFLNEDREELFVVAIQGLRDRNVKAGIPKILQTMYTTRNPIIFANCVAYTEALQVSELFPGVVSGLESQRPEMIVHRAIMGIKNLKVVSAIEKLEHWVDDQRLPQTLTPDGRVVSQAKWPIGKTARMAIESLLKSLGKTWHEENLG